MEISTSLDQKTARRLRRVRAYILAHKALFTARGTVVAGWRTYRGRLLGPYYRVAFSDGTRQRSLYLGASPELADAIRGLLADLQRPLRRRRNFRRVIRQARAGLRWQKALLNQELNRWGLYLKGFEFRGWYTGVTTPVSRQATSGRWDGLPMRPTATASSGRYAPPAARTCL